MTQFRKGTVYPQPVGGAIVPKEYIDGCSLQMIENILGFRNGRLKDGAIVVQLDSMITSEELDYYGDTSAPFDQFEDKRNQ